jgi:cytochrome c-type biogenesis protein CcsB
VGRLEILFGVSLYAYLASAVICAVWFFWRNKGLWIAGMCVLGLALALQVAFIAGLGITAGRPPFKDTFETLVFLAACLTAFYFASLFLYKTKLLAPLAVIASLLVTLFASLIMPDEIEHLVPALRDSFWLTVHVAFCIVSYAAFLLAHVVALAYLVKVEKHTIGAALGVAFTVTGIIGGITLVFLKGHPSWHGSRWTVFGLVALGVVLAAAALWPLILLVGSKARVRERMPGAAELERMVYKAVAVGFPFLTLGIITGSVWASQAWGRYWGWDDKETASLITWLVFAVYLHLRIVPKWRGPWVAWIAVAGFLCVIFTFFGVNYLSSGLHSYG